jgi:ankyrin repeat protein
MADGSFSPLHWAAYHGDVAKVKDILGASGKDLERVVEDHENEPAATPLQWACVNGDIAVVRLLLNAGAKLEYKDLHGQVFSLATVL